MIPNGLNGFWDEKKTSKFSPDRRPTAPRPLPPDRWSDVFHNNIVQRRVLCGGASYKCQSLSCMGAVVSLTPGNVITQSEG